MTDFFSEATGSFLKPISSFLQDEDVSEIMINGAKEIYVEKKGMIHKAKASFDDEEHLMAAVRRVAQTMGRQVDENHPILDARLEDGSRVHVVLPPCAKNGIYLSIRKFSSVWLGMKELVKAGGLTLEMAKFLNLCVALSKNILVSGGTSSGKTTLLNTLSTLIPPTERIVVIEDATELSLQQDHVLPLETKAADKHGEGAVSMRDLVRASLRMRPDRIVIGEVRGGEAMDLLQAMNTGHSGSMTTLHANTPKSALSRLETLAMMSDIELPLVALRSQVATAIDIVVQTSRLRDGSRKITAISEVTPLTESGQYQVRDLFAFAISKVAADGKIEGGHVPTGEMPTFLAEAKAQGYTVDESLFTV